MPLIVGLAVFVAQALGAPSQAYTTPGGLLETQDAQYALSFGHNCDAIALGSNVAFWPVAGEPDQAVLAPLDAAGQPDPLASGNDGGVQSLMCSAYIDRTADEPCARNASGVCDIGSDPAFSALAP